MDATEGRLVVEDDGSSTVRIVRLIPAPRERVWAALTEPERLEPWIGTYTGDPASGRVSFRMTAEGEDVAASDWEISACEPRSLLALATAVGEQRWRLELRLDDQHGATLLCLRQPGIDPTAAGDVGPGWEYYLDRLAASVTGGDVAAVDFERDYYPARSERDRPPGAKPAAACAAYRIRGRRGGRTRPATRRWRRAR